MPSIKTNKTCPKKGTLVVDQGERDIIESKDNHHIDVWQKPP